MEEGKKVDMLACSYERVSKHESMTKQDIDRGQGHHQYSPANKHRSPYQTAVSVSILFQFRKMVPWIGLGKSMEAGSPEI